MDNPTNMDDFGVPPYGRAMTCSPADLPGAPPTDSALLRWGPGAESSSPANGGRTSEEVEQPLKDRTKGSMYIIV